MDLALRLACLLACCGLPGLLPALDLDVREQGAVGDGATIVTGILQRAIDLCSAAGGGVVTVPAGRYLIGTLSIKDQVTLRLLPSAVLLGSPAADDYRNPDPFKDGLGAEMGWALLVAKDARHIRIEGQGAIDGQGTEVAARQKASGGYHRRPFLLRLIRCQDVAVSGLHLSHPGAWTMNLFQCREVAIDRISIDSHGLGNNDGIDIDSCQGVQVTGCTIDSDDDALCLKTTSSMPCQDIAASGCTLRSRCGAIKLGTESAGDFSRIAIRDCHITGARIGGIKLLSGDGAHLAEVTIFDIRMEHVRVPIFIRLGARLKTFRGEAQGRAVGSIRDIVIRNIQATDASQVGVLVSGIPAHPVEAVTMENISIQLAGGGTAQDALASLEEKEPAYPEIGMFGATMPAYGVIGRHVRELTITGLTLTLLSQDARPASLLVDAEDRHFTGWSVPGGSR